MEIILGILAFPSWRKEERSGRPTFMFQQQGTEGDSKPEAGKAPSLHKKHFYRSCKHLWLGFSHEQEQRSEKAAQKRTPALEPDLSAGALTSVNVTRAVKWSEKLYSQQPKSGNSLNAHQQINGENVVCLYLYLSISIYLPICVCALSHFSHVWLFGPYARAHTHIHTHTHRTITQPWKNKIRKVHICLQQHRWTYYHTKWSKSENDKYHMIDKYRMMSLICGI